MCRGKDHGDRRCPNDTAEARRKRRKVAAGKLLYESLPEVVDKRVIARNVEAMEKMPTMKSIIKETEIVSALLSQRLHPDPVEQAKIDAKNEILVTSLGHKIAMEAEKRAGYDPETEMRESLERSKALSRPVRILSQRIKAINIQLKTMNSSTLSLDEYERFGELRSELDYLTDQCYKAEDEFDRAEAKNDAWEKAEDAKKSQILSDAYKAVIAEIRPVGGDVESHRLNDPEADEIIAESVGKDFPSSWIEQSNNHGPLIALLTSERPGYYDEKLVLNDHGDDLHVARDFGGFILSAEEAKSFTDKLSEDGDIVTLKSSPFYDDGSDGDAPGWYHVIKVPTRVAFDPELNEHENGRPLGDGWKHGYTEDSLNDDETPKKQWYRSKALPGKSAGHIYVAPKDTKIEMGSKSIAYHEFGHRAEHVVNNGVIPRLEESFLKRRTTTNGKRDELLPMYSPTGDLEMTRRDSFMHEYIGKEYLDANAREVFTVGLEAAYGGRMGAFRGLGVGHREDMDHRGLTLGILASA